ncbi:hypothetical protein G6F68_018250 [Rhizopus microsporus]|nr:hypothetical protein G6F68_018250 [Rhizopus microsporus]
MDISDHVLGAILAAAGQRRADHVLAHVLGRHLSRMAVCDRLAAQTCHRVGVEDLVALVRSGRLERHPVKSHHHDFSFNGRSGRPGPRIAAASAPPSTGNGRACPDGRRAAACPIRTPALPDRRVRPAHARPRRRATGTS